MTPLDIAIEAANAAGTVIRAHSDGPTRVEHKGRVDLVTEVDLASEAALRAVLQRHSPDIPILAEEGGGATDAKTRWVADPLDGTTNFVHGFPMFAVSIALEIDGVAEVGVVLDPLRDLAYTAQRGGGAHCNGRPIHVSNRHALDKSLLATGFAYDRREQIDRYLAPFRAFLLQAQGIRRAGSAAMDLAMVAAGMVDGYWEFNLRPWDVAAGMLLVREAGGEVTGHDGGRVDGDWPSPLASNGSLHPAMLDVLRQTAQLS